MLKIIKSKILGIKKIYPMTSFTDIRGKYLETFNKKIYKKFFKIDFVEDDFSLNKKNVLRGIHGDNKTWKLVCCVYGKCLAIIVNCDPKSKKFGKWESFLLSPKNFFQILIPPKYGNSFLVLSKFAVYHYKQSKYYDGDKKQFTYNLFDPFFKIKLKNTDKLILSKRDKNATFVNQLKD